MSDDAFDDEEDAWYWEEKNAEHDGWSCVRCATSNAAANPICDGCGLPKEASVWS